MEEREGGRGCLDSILDSAVPMGERLELSESSPLSLGAVDCVIERARECELGVAWAVVFEVDVVEGEEVGSKVAVGGGAVLVLSERRETSFPARCCEPSLSLLFSRSRLLVD